MPESTRHPARTPAPADGELRALLTPLHRLFELQTRSFTKWITRMSIKAVLAAIITQLLDFGPILLVGLLTVVTADTATGVMAARRRGETVRKSRMMRRMLTKLGTYFWVVGGAIVAGNMFRVMENHLPTWSREAQEIAYYVVAAIIVTELSSMWENAMLGARLRSSLRTVAEMTRLRRAMIDDDRDTKDSAGDEERDSAKNIE